MATIWRLRGMFIEFSRLGYWHIADFSSLIIQDWEGRLPHIGWMVGAPRTCAAKGRVSSDGRDEGEDGVERSRRRYLLNNYYDMRPVRLGFLAGNFSRPHVSAYE